MTISFDNINTRSYTAVILMLLILFSCSIKAEDDITQQLLQCREETSALIRLDCYDNTLKSKYGDLEKQKKPIFSSEIAARILAQEKNAIMRILIISLRVKHKAPYQKRLFLLYQL